MPLFNNLKSIPEIYFEPHYLLISLDQPANESFILLVRQAFNQNIFSIFYSFIVPLSCFLELLGH